MTTLYIVLGVLALILVLVVLLQRHLVALRNRAEEAWSDIDVQLKRRYDLIPNLVETVKGYAAHERQTLESVTQARANALNAQTVAEHAQAEDMLTGALKSLFAVSESYPDLKANQNFLELQRELSDTENKIMASRRFYNTSVQTLNTAIEQFPNNLVAGPMGFQKKEFFELSEADAAAREPVAVSF